MADEFIPYAVVPTPKQLKQLPHSELYNLREKYKGNQEAQDLISAYEHAAFAREAVQENPAMFIPLLVGIPAYNIYKQVTGAGRSNPSLKQVTEGYKGAIEGLVDTFIPNSTSNRATNTPLLSTAPLSGGLKATNRANPYGLRSYPLNGARRWFCKLEALS